MELLSFWGTRQVTKAVTQTPQITQWFFIVEPHLKILGTVSYHCHQSSFVGIFL